MDKIFKYNPNAKYLPNGGGYLQQIRDHNIYLQNITVSDNKLNHSSFPIKFENIFTKYIIDNHSENVYKTWNDDRIVVMADTIKFCHVLCY